MSNLLYRIGRYSAGNPWRVLLTWFLIAAAVIVSSSLWGRDLDDAFAVPGLDSQVAIDLLEAAQSDEAGLSAQFVLVTADGDTFFSTPAAVDQLAELTARADELEHIVRVTGPATMLEGDPELAVRSGLVSPDGTVAIVQLLYTGVDELSAQDFDSLNELRNELDAESDTVQIEARGELFATFAEVETGIGEAIGLVAAVIILLLAFGSIIAMLLPIGMALFGLALGFSAMSLLTYLIAIPNWAPSMGSMVGLGVGIDYALFLVTRHREFLSRNMTVVESAGRATATAGQAVVFAGGTVVVAILGLAVAGIPFVTAAGVATSLIVLIMVIASITLLPAFLGLAGTRIDRRSVRAANASVAAGAHAEPVSSRWTAWGTHVAKHAWLYAIGVTVALLALTSPALALSLGFPDDGTLPESRTERRAYDLVAEGFGPGTNGPLLVAVDASRDATVIDDLAAGIGQDPGIAGVAPAGFEEASGIATILAFPTTAPQDDATVDTIKRLRAEVFPAAIGERDASAHITGTTAVFGDIGGRVSERLPLFILAVVVLSFLLLTLVFRSILVPLKAALLNLLSIGSAYGVLVMVFQWGWGLGLIGVDAPVPIVSFVPMFMFAVLFGLSMDYEVFLLSRVREEYLETGDNDSSVIHGIASTARVITSAALIMISVFLGFVLGDDPVIKMMGLGLATAIFVDATIVRMVLVPATMRLMGDANWWIPAWLDRLLPTIDIEGESGLPPAEFVEVVSTEQVASR